MIPTVDLAFRWAPRHAGSLESVRRYPPPCSPARLCAVRPRVDHYNIRHVLLFSAMLMVSSYGLLLLLLRRYLGGRLTSLSVFAVGIVWLSLADVHNSLWSFQVAWYLATFFFVVTIYVLLGPHRYRTIFFSLGIVAAVAASYSIVQGFAVWPAGLICILWNRPWVRRTYVEGAAWLAAAADHRGRLFARLQHVGFPVRRQHELRGGLRGAASVSVGPIRRAAHGQLRSDFVPAPEPHGVRGCSELRWPSWRASWSFSRSAAARRNRAHFRWS